jgi:formylglycine-generating enzyme required for sulfatase activity
MIIPWGRAAAVAGSVLCILLPLAWLPGRDGRENAKRPARVTNSIGMELVCVPAGEFFMGGQEPADRLVRAFKAYERKADYFDDEYPRHRVRITRPFLLGKFEVTVGQFRQFVQASRYRTEAERDGTGGWGYNPETQKCEGRKRRYTWRDPGFAQTDNHPVVNVTWNDAEAFCRWLSRKEGKTYRLPTEAEWEYACRAGTTTHYHHGDDPDLLPRVGKVTSDKGKSNFPPVQVMLIPRGEADCFTVPVGRYRPNAWGLHDMHGNVWEWCADRYGEEYYAKSPVADPRGPDSGKSRVRRGGGWNSFPLWVRAAFRNVSPPDTRCLNLGFRVAQEVKVKP